MISSSVYGSQSILRQTYATLRGFGYEVICSPVGTLSVNPTEPNHHLFSWNVQTLGNLVSDSGFNIQELDLGKFRFDRYAAEMAHRFHRGERTFRVLRRLGLLVAPEFEIRLIATFR